MNEKKYYYSYFYNSYFKFLKILFISQIRFKKLETI